MSEKTRFEFQWIISLTLLILYFWRTKMWSLISHKKVHWYVLCKDSWKYLLELNSSLLMLMGSKGSYSLKQIIGKNFNFLNVCILNFCSQPSLIWREKRSRQPKTVKASFSLTWLYTPSSKYEMSLKKSIWHSILRRFCSWVLLASRNSQMFLCSQMGSLQL